MTINQNTMTALDSSAGRPSGLKIWWSAARPATLTASFAPVGVGTALAYSADVGILWVAALALLGALFIQIGTNFANDLQDFIRGADNEERVGPARATQKGWVSTRQMTVATVVAFGLAALCGVGLIIHAGWPVVAIGVVSVLSGLAYTAGPAPLAYVGLGDLFVLAFFGPVAVGGTFYVQAGHLPNIIYIAAIPVGLLATSILVVNNLRDRVTDAAANKKTLAVRLGAKMARVEYSLLVAFSYLIPVIAWGTGHVPGAWLLCLAALPFGLKETVLVWKKDGAKLNAHLKGAAQHGLLFSLFLSVGVLL